MQGRGRTQREDYLEDIQKMERHLKDEDPKPKPALTTLEKAAALLQTTKYNMAYAKLRLQEIEDLLAKQRPKLKDDAILEREVEIAKLRESLGNLKRSFYAIEAELKSKSTYPKTIPTLT